MTGLEPGSIGRERVRWEWMINHSKCSDMGGEPNRLHMRYNDKGKYKEKTETTDSGGAAPMEGREPEFIAKRLEHRLRR